MKRMTTFLIATALSLAGGSLAAGPSPGREVDRTVPASADGTVSIELLAGRVELVGWDRNEVRITGRLGADVEELEVDADGDEVSIEVELRRGNTLRHAGAELTLRVPRRSSLDVETISAGIEIEGVEGAIEVETVSGGVRVLGGSREIEVATVSGRIEVDKPGRVRDLELASVSGKIEFGGALSPGGDYTFEAVSGAITLLLDGEISADFSIETFSGSIENDFGPEPRTADFVPSKSLEFTEGGGSADVTIESFSGRIVLRRR